MKIQNPLSKAEDIFENKQHSGKEVELEADFLSHTDGKVEPENQHELVFTQSGGVDDLCVLPGEGLKHWRICCALPGEGLKHWRICVSFPGKI